MAGLCAEGAPLSGSAEEHVKANHSPAILGPPGVGKTHWVKEQLRESQQRLFWVAKTHVASQGLSKDAVTLARLYRRYLSTGALPRESTVVIDEISLLTHRDFETCVPSDL